MSFYGFDQLGLSETPQWLSQQPQFSSAQPQTSCCVYHNEIYIGQCPQCLMNKYYSDSLAALLENKSIPKPKFNKKLLLLL